MTKKLVSYRNCGVREYLMNKDKDIFDRIMEWKILSIFNPFYKKYKEVLLYLFFGGLTTIISIALMPFLMSVCI